MGTARRYIQKLARHGNSLQVAIPVPLLYDLKLGKGDHLVCSRVGDSILLTPVEDVIRTRVAAEHAALAPAEPLTA